MHTFLLALYVDLVSSKFTNLGKTFVLALPRMRERPELPDTHIIQFFMFTFHHKDITVSIRTHFITNPRFRLNELVTLEPRKVSEYTHHTENLVQKQIGVSWSYRLHCSKPFALHVHVRPHRSSMSSFQAIPVTSWGRSYYAVTLLEYPSIQIISNIEKNMVRIRFRFHGTTSPSLIYSNLNYAQHMNLHVELGKRRTFSIHHCDQVTDRHNGSMTGTRINGQHPIGVISGNCNTATYTTNCRSNEPTRWGTTVDIVTEMLLPVEAYGTEFVVIALRERNPLGVLIIVSSENDTEVSVLLTSDGRSKNFTLNVAGDVNTDVAMDDHRILFSDKKIQVVMMTRSACWNSDDIERIGDSSISLLVPNYLFYVEYFWITPAITPDSFAALVAEMDHIEYIVFNLVPLPDTMAWSEVIGSSSFRVTSIKATPGSHSVASTHYFKFGCYLFGMKHKAGYMYPAGFDEACIPTLKDMVPDDGIDNDCDGVIDEETINGVDEDDDEQVDEDTFLVHRKNVTAVHGGWGEWEPWACFPSCEITRAFRSRTCNKQPPRQGGRLCVGSDEESTNITCAKDEGCIPVCDDFSWGKECDRSCANCADKCDTRSGVCTSCKQGFKNHIGGCDTKCGMNEYGAGCRGRCSVKCGAGVDCVDRVTGDCPKIRTKILIYSPFLMVIPVFLLLLMTRKRHVNTTNVESDLESSSED